MVIWGFGVPSLSSRLAGVKSFCKDERLLAQSPASKVPFFPEAPGVFRAPKVSGHSRTKMPAQHKNLPCPICAIQQRSDRLVRHIYSHRKLAKNVMTKESLEHVIKNKIPLMYEYFGNKLKYAVCLICKEGRTCWSKDEEADWVANHRLSGCRNKYNTVSHCFGDGSCTDEEEYVKPCLIASDTVVQRIGAVFGLSPQIMTKNLDCILQACIVAFHKTRNAHNPKYLSTSADGYIDENLNRISYPKPVPQGPTGISGTSETATLPSSPTPELTPPPSPEPAANIGAPNPQIITEIEGTLEPPKPLIVKKPLKKNTQVQQTVKPQDVQPVAVLVESVVQTDFTNIRGLTEKQVETKLRDYIDLTLKHKTPHKEAGAQLLEESASLDDWVKHHKCHKMARLLKMFQQYCNGLTELEELDESYYRFDVPTDN